MERIALWFQVIILIVIGIFESVFMKFLYFLYCSMKAEILLQNDNYMIINNEFIELTFAIAGIIMFAIIMLKLCDDKNYFPDVFLFQRLINKCRKASIKRIAIIFCPCFFLVLFFQIFSYTIVSADGITYRENLLFKDKQYNWDNMKEAKIFYSIETPHKHPELIIRYDVTTNDNKQFNLFDSEQFWDKILTVDELIQ